MRNLYTDKVFSKILNCKFIQYGENLSLGDWFVKCKSKAIFKFILEEKFCDNSNFPTVHFKIDRQI
jgi:hypothetical protein